MAGIAVASSKRPRPGNGFVEMGGIAMVSSKSIRGVNGSVEMAGIGMGGRTGRNRDVCSSNQKRLEEMGGIATASSKWVPSAKWLRRGAGVEMASSKSFRWDRLFAEKNSKK